jgi:hypothetical protein
MEPLYSEINNLEKLVSNFSDDLPVNFNSSYLNGLEKNHCHQKFFFTQSNFLILAPQKQYLSFSCFSVNFNYCFFFLKNSKNIVFPKIIFKKVQKNFH